MPTHKYLPVLVMAGMFILFLCNRDGEEWVAVSRKQSFHIDTHHVLPGDLIFRKGISMVSNIVRLVDGEIVYTHVGIIVADEGKTMVVHAVPGEGDGPDCVKMESLDDFIDSQRANEVAIYRPIRELGDSIPLQAAAYALMKARINTSFDARFNLQDTTRLYCTELIWRAYLSAGVDICNDQFDMMSLSIGKGPYIFPSRLLHSAYFEPANFLITKNYSP